MRAFKFAGFVPLAIALAACGPSGPDTNDPPDDTINQNTSSGGQQETQIDPGDEGGRCLQGQVCNLPNLCDVGQGKCRRDANAGRQGGACLETGGCNMGLQCIGSICLAQTGSSSGMMNPPPVGPAVGTEGGPCSSGDRCLTGLLCVTLANSDKVCQNDNRPPQGSRGGACYGNNSCDIGNDCNLTNHLCTAPVAGGSSSGQVGSSSGTVGSSSSGGTVGPDRRGYYTTNVKGELTSRCSTCHAAGQTIGPAFMGQPDYYQGTTTYTSTVGGSFIKNAPNLQNSLLVNKGEHAGPTSIFTADTRVKVANWLDMEWDAAHPAGSSSSGAVGSSSGAVGSSSGTVGGNPVLTATGAVDAYGKCMLLTDFNANATGTNTNFTNLSQQGSTQGQCSACHSTGVGGAYISANAANNYTYNKISPYVLKLALPSQKTDGTFTMVASNRFRDKGQETGTHPKYILTANREAAVSQLFSRTLLRYEANTADCRTVGSGP